MPYFSVKPLILLAFLGFFKILTRHANRIFIIFLITPSSLVYPRFSLIFKVFSINSKLLSLYPIYSQTAFSPVLSLFLHILILIMSVIPQRNCNVRMTHEILQGLWRHSIFDLISTVGMTACMRSYLGQLLKVYNNQLIWPSTRFRAYNNLD